MAKVIMKKLNGMSWFAKTSLVLLLTLATTVIMDDGALNPHQASATGVATIPNCSGCHGSTAAFNDGTARNTPAGQFQGSHNKHVIGRVMPCSGCHIVPATTTVADNAHSTGQIQMAATISGGTYSTTSPFAVANPFSPGTCSATSCHANIYGSSGVASPAWGTSSTGCAACHTVASGGAITTTGPATGSHVKHNNTNCSLCHLTATTSATAPTSNHIDGNINVSDGYPATVTKHTFNTGYTGTCSTASCHANPYVVGGTVTTPVWGVTSGCASCHTVASGGALASTGPATGSHVKHNNADCSQCHLTATTFSTAPTSNHIDGNINVSDGYPATVTKHTFNTGYTGTCSTASCHANPYGTGTSTTPIWGVVSGCNACHGSNPITATGPNTGSHANHHLFACTECHNANTTATSSPTLNHATGFIDVVNIGYATNVTKHTAGTGYSTCSTLACHVGTTSATALWGSTTLDCVSCHSYTVMINAGTLAGGTRPAVAASLKTSGTRNHKSTTAGSDATKWDCIVCHMEGDPTTGATTTSHANGVIDFRDPDTGLQVKKVQWTGVGAAGAYSDNPALTNFTTARFTRDLSKTLENDPQWLRVATVQVNLCLKCHDTNGAASSASWTKNAAGALIGTANQPFGNAVGNTSTLYPITATVQNAANNTVGAVMNIKSSFAPTNASHHAVLGKGNNGFTGTATMKAPWNAATTPVAKVAKTNTVYGWLISCFDCHGASSATTSAAGVQTGTVVAHGNGSTSTTTMLRGVPYTSTPTAGAPNLCTVCHGDNYFATQNHGTNSAMAAGDTNGTNFMTDSRGGIGCAICHVTATANLSARSVAVHGFDVTEAGLAQHTTTNSRPYAFMRGGLKVPYWGPGTCSISGCTTSGTYTPGGLY